VAVLNGSGPLANETIVVGAHYDHIGRGSSGKEEIRNGADDNASGTAAVVEIARALFQRRDDSPRRRIVFVAFSAEESGLIGSRNYVEHPPFPLEQTKAMVNLDMVGRLNNNRLTIGGTGTGKQFEGLLDELNKKYAFELTKQPSSGGGSDHASFQQKKIPAVHFFTGTHPDYHRPSDDFDKINVEGMARITEMAIDLVDRLARTEQAPDYVEVAPPQRARGGNRPFLGVVVGSGAEGQGCELTQVEAGSPASQADLRAGDRLLEFDGDPVSSAAELQNLLRKRRPGDIVAVQVKRGERTVNFRLTLGGGP
jgi:Zn-dependent M28 family amino/carboxypeptidase